MKLIYLFLPLLVFTFMTACSDEDTMKPRIEIISPEDHAHFHPGEVIPLVVIMTDNEELASWKVDIHYNTDGHIHKSTSLANDEALNEWHDDWTGIIPSGLKSYKLTLDINIPDNVVSGEYHLGVFVSDKSGNENKVFIEIEIEDDEDDHTI